MVSYGVLYSLVYTVWLSRPKWDQFSKSFSINVIVFYSTSNI